MGTITKRPKLPRLQASSASTPSVAVAVPDTEPVGKTEEQRAEDARTQSLLRRSRGRFGTILTGFNGFLNSENSSENEPRKTLLGE